MAKRATQKKSNTTDSGLNFEAQLWAAANERDEYLAANVFTAPARPSNTQILADFIQLPTFLLTYFVIQSNQTHIICSPSYEHETEFPERRAALECLAESSLVFPRAAADDSVDWHAGQR